MSGQSAENGRRLSVVTITCRTCGRVLSQSIPRVSEPDEVDTEQPCSPAFAQWATCPDHPAGPPDQGLRYSTDALPLMWTVRCITSPEASADS